MTEAQFEAHDMATAAAQGFRDGVASAMAGEPVAWMTFTEEGDPDMVFLDRLEACQYCEDDDQPKPLYLAAHNHVQRDLESAAAEVAKLRGQRMVLCSLLGECLPVIEAMLQIPGDDDSDAHLNGLAGRITGALNALAEDQVTGGES